MADRSIVVRLQAVVTDFQSKFKQAAAASDELANKLTKVTPAINTMGTAATRAGVVIAAGLAFAAKAAIDWESAWAGVTKTVDGSTGQLAALEGELRNMAKTLPSTHEEIAAVAEAAGQLGVRTQDIAGFTKVMIDLGQTTNISAEEAATSLAQFMNVMGTSADRVSNLGSTIVDLGNKGASTERDIVQMGQRIAAAGKTVGMSESDVLGFASALASVGIEAEAGGTAISSSFKKIDAAVRKGGDSLDLIAKTAGMSAAQFKQAWGEDAAGATQSFIEGLGGVKQAGGDANGILSELGITGIREADSLMRLALAGTLLGDSLDTAGSAWDANSALAAEAGKRYETTASQMKIAWNNIQDAAIEAGGVMLPVLADMAGNVSGLAQSFGSLPGPVKTVGVQFAGLAAGSLLAFGGISKLVTTGLELRSAMSALSVLHPKVASGLTAIGKAAAAAAVALAALRVANAILGNDWKKTETGADDLAAAILKASAAGVDMDGKFKFSEGALLVEKFDGLGASMVRALNPTPIQKFGDAMNGLVGSTVLADQIVSQFGEMDKALGTLASGGKGDLAAAQFKKVQDAAVASGVGMDELVKLFPAYKSELDATAKALGVVGLSSQEMADWMGGKIPPAVAAAAAASKSADPNIKGLSKAFDAVAEAAKNAGLATEKYLGVISAKETQLALAKAANEAAAAIKENGKGMDENTAKGQANWAVMLDLAKAYQSVSGTAEEVSSGQAYAALKFAEAAVAATDTRAAAAKLTAQYLGIPLSVATQITAPGATLSQAEIEAVIVATNLIPGLKEATILAPGARDSKSDVDAFVASIGTVPGLTPAEIRAIADLYGVDQAKAAIASVQGKTVTVTVTASYTADAFRLLRGGSSGAMFEQSGSAGLTKSFASGGFSEPRRVGSIGSRSPGIYPFAGKAGVIMNEEGSGPWEGIVSGHPSKKARSRMITQQIAHRLGGNVAWMADGGVMGGGMSPGAGNSADIAAAFRAAMSGAELRLTGAVDTIGDAVAGRIMLAYEGAV